MRTTEELERAAYIAGDTATAELLARIAELEEKNDEMEEKNDEMEKKIDEMEKKIDELEEKLANDSLSEWNRLNGDAEQYKDFFCDCFYRLNGHYPAPDISLDHDKSVIFEAIERGEGIAASSRADALGKVRKGAV